MKTSDAGLLFIKEQEGCVLHVYRDFAGILSIGIGHAIRQGEHFDTLTDEEALELLSHDLRIAETVVNEHVQVSLSQGQFDALVDFTFNCGGGAFMSSTVLRRLNQGNYCEAADALLMWDKYTECGVKKVSVTLHQRRLLERAMFLADMSDNPY